MASAFPTPRPTPLSAPFWKATRAGEFRLQRCCDCGAWRWTPQILCRACLSEDFRWEIASGRGTLYSVTTVHRPPTPAFAAPYMVAVVTLEEGPLMLTTLIDMDPADVEIGMAVKVRLTALDDDITLYPFTAA